MSKYVNLNELLRQGGVLFDKMKDALWRDSEMKTLELRAFGRQNFIMGIGAGALAASAIGATYVTCKKHKDAKDVERVIKEARNQRMSGGVV